MQLIDKGGANGKREQGMAKSVATTRSKTKELAISKNVARGRQRWRRSWRLAKKMATLAEELAEKTTTLVEELTASEELAGGQKELARDRAETVGLQLVKRSVKPFKAEG